MASLWYRQLRSNQDAPHVWTEVGRAPVGVAAVVCWCWICTAIHDVRENGQHPLNSLNNVNQFRAGCVHVRTLPAMVCTAVH